MVHGERAHGNTLRTAGVLRAAQERAIGCWPGLPGHRAGLHGLARCSLVRQKHALSGSKAMKLSRTVTYAIQATLQLAQSKSGGPVPCSQLAACSSMPER